MSRRFYKVTGLVPKTWTEDDIVRFWRVAPSDFREAAIARDRRDLLGKTFVMEQLECGHTGECLGIAGDPGVKRPATKRICDFHDDEDDEDDAWPEWCPVCGCARFGCVRGCTGRPSPPFGAPM